MHGALAAERTRVNGESSTPTIANSLLASHELHSLILERSDNFVISLALMDCYLFEDLNSCWLTPCHVFFFSHCFNISSLSYSCLWSFYLHSIHISNHSMCRQPNHGDLLKLIIAVPTWQQWYRINVIQKGIVMSKVYLVGSHGKRSSSTFTKDRAEIMVREAYTYRPSTFS